MMLINGDGKQGSGEQPIWVRLLRSMGMNIIFESSMSTAMRRWRL